MADVNPLYGDGPYTVQVGGCGERGEYIHITSDYIKNMMSDYAVTYGPPGLIAHAN
jgi:hypothetical protein